MTSVIMGAAHHAAAGLPPAMANPVEVPGRPTVVGLPGHTRGSVGFVVPDRDVCFSGDALVTLDLLTGLRGPRLLGRAFMEASRQAFSSLDRLAEPTVGTMLSGHPYPWRGSMSDAVAKARAAGIR